MEIAIARAAVKMLKFQTDPLPPGALNCLDRSQNESPRLPAPYKPVGKCIYCSAERYRPGSHAFRTSNVSCSIFKSLYICQPAMSVGKAASGEAGGALSARKAMA